MSAASAGLQQVAQVVSDASTRLAAHIEQSDKGACETSLHLTEAANAIQQMNKTVHQVAQNAAAANAASLETRQKAEQGAEIVKRSLHSISEVHHVSLATKNDMAQLREHTQNINRIMNVISDIADQTNLLALNAAIEAARAGDAGRGFAVVADEVRKLAEKTMQATKEVTEAITTIQSVAKGNMQEMRDTADTVSRATEMANQSGAALSQIVEIVASASNSVQSIATAAEQQSATSEEINRAITDVKHVAETTNALTRELHGTVAELSRLAAQLKALSQG